jgi:hypothetical protein
MLYMANWGSRQLMFRFPTAALDVERVNVYCQPLIVQDYVSLSAVGEYTVLNVRFHDEEGHDVIEGRGWLAAMVSLRDDILRGDNRALYLAWLKTLEVEDLLDSVIEPPVPPGLKTLSPALCKIVDFFEIDERLIQVAAGASGDWRAQHEGWLPRALSRLPREEGDAFLLRLAQGERHLSVKLNRRLQQVAPLPKRGTPPRRTVGQLLRERKVR